MLEGLGNLLSRKHSTLRESSTGTPKMSLVGVCVCRALGLGNQFVRFLCMVRNLWLSASGSIRCYRVNTVLQVAGLSVSALDSCLTLYRLFPGGISALQKQRISKEVTRYLCRPLPVTPKP